MKRYHTYVFAVILLAGCSATHRDIVKVNPVYEGKFEILSKRIGADEATYVFRGSEGIFSFDLEPGRLSFKKVTFILKDQRKVASLSLGRSSNDWNELYSVRLRESGAPSSMPGSTAPGVAVRQNGNDFHVTFTGAGIDLLERGGRFQVIDEWRR